MDLGHSGEDEEIRDRAEEISGVMLIEVEPASPVRGISWSSRAHPKPSIAQEGSTETPSGAVGPPPWASVPGGQVRPPTGLAAFMKRVVSWFTPDRGAGFLDEGFDDLKIPREVAPSDEVLVFAEPNSGEQPVLRV